MVGSAATETKQRTSTSVILGLLVSFAVGGKPRPQTLTRSTGDFTRPRKLVRFKSQPGERYSAHLDMNGDVISLLGPELVFDELEV